MMTIRLCHTMTVMLIAAATTTLVHAYNKPAPILNRRNLFGVVGSAALLATTTTLVAPQAAQAQAAIRTGAVAPFAGDYDDPNHPGCLRQVKVVGAPLKGDGTRPFYPVMEVTGYDGKSTASSVCSADDRPTRADLWKVQGSVRSNTEVLLDFSPKGGPSGLKGVYQDEAIVFPDGNKWTKVPGGTNNRRPIDMSTLKSAS